MKDLIIDNITKTIFPVFSYLEWDIIGDNFEEIENNRNQENTWGLSIDLVDCKVLIHGGIYDGQIMKWCLRYDEYVYRTAFLDYLQIKDEDVNQKIKDELLETMKTALQNIKDIEMGEEEAGESL
jgi:hypothetical protein